MSAMSQDDFTLTRTDPSKTEIELTVTISGTALQRQYQKEIEKLAAKTEIKGFRAGKAPIGMVEKTRGEDADKEALENLLAEYAAEAMKQENLRPAATPRMEIVERDGRNRVVFKLTVPVIPDVHIPDLSKLKTEKELVTVDAKEVDDVLKRLWQDKRGAHKDKTDAWVAEIAPGIGFTSRTLKDLREELRVAIRKEKERIVDRTYSEALLHEAMNMTSIEVPRSIIDSEAAEREKSFRESLLRVKMTEEEFCKGKNVTMEELRQQWHKDAEEAVKTDVFLATYVRKKEIEVSDAELEKEISMLRSSSANPNDPVFDNEVWRGYIERVLLKRKAFTAFLGEAVAHRPGNPIPGVSDSKSAAQK